MGGGGDTPAGFTFPSPAPSAVRSVVDPDDVAGGFGATQTQTQPGQTPGTQGQAGDEPQTLVWGTTVSIQEDSNRFKRFLENFELPSREGVAHYHRLLTNCFEKENYQLDLDCRHLDAYDPPLYRKLTSYPQEIVPLFDQVANEYFAESVLPEGEEVFTRVQVRPFNLKETRAMRDLNPSDIDKLVAVRGMVTRCTGTGLSQSPRSTSAITALCGVQGRTPFQSRIYTRPYETDTFGVNRDQGIIPDLKMAYFKCLVCGDAPDLTFVDRGRVNEPPLKCANSNCESIGTMTLVHNRCVFANKQQIKMQETPDAIPEGETPHTVSMCVFDSLVDECKPGDRVEITGVYRAVPIRAAPNLRILKSVYKTYVDVIHVRKDSASRINNTAGSEDREDLNEHTRHAAAERNGAGDQGNTLETPSGAGPNAEAEFTPERVEFLEAIGKRHDVYERLVSSLAPSIWEMEEVKKGLLCQLFGATHKVFKGTNANKVRGDINVILVGDPGVSKSQLLTYVNKVAPRGIYTSGRGSSAVGLTAYVTRDPESKDMVLESGALVLSDRGICCIDEFDKMSDGARSTLHEVMVSISPLTTQRLCDCPYSSCEGTAIPLPITLTVYVINLTTD
jgi:DNA replication licensing factor MCM4|tara:strand:+ start:874 stop:2730 length:1857 start_codon:yes stop_codon:yes gene_type:complete